nr:protein FAR1-RELATED SEQUENCE 5-like [Ipomoea trifida]
MPAHRGVPRVNNLYDEFFKCVGQTYGNKKRLIELAQLLKAHRDKLVVSMTQNESRVGKSHMIRSYCGSTASPTIEVYPTWQPFQRTKGLESV